MGEGPQHATGLTVPTKFVWCLEHGLTATRSYRRGSGRPRGDANGPAHRDDPDDGARLVAFRKEKTQSH